MTVNLFFKNTKKRRKLYHGHVLNTLCIIYILYIILYIIWRGYGIHTIGYYTIFVYTGMHHHQRKLRYSHCVWYWYGVFSNFGAENNGNHFYITYNLWLLLILDSGLSKKQSFIWKDINRFVVRIVFQQ